LRQNLVDLGQKDELSGSVTSCLQAAFEKSNPGDRILIFGSFYTVAEGLRVLQTASVAS
jgi:dihydrofolate synthase / folylpolyglutamate synthase